MEALVQKPSPEPVTRLEWRGVRLLQAAFFLVALVHLNGPFVSCHYVRQNHTFDVARHVFQEGWRAVAMPRAGFSSAELPAQPYTIIHLEVPFHGLFGWPAAKLLGAYTPAIGVLVSVVFAMWSIQGVYLVLRRWLEAPSCLFGAALWALAPMVLHFGQVPMPDILNTTGMIASFLFALRGNAVLSSATFLFALLAKMSVLPFGLPILVALVVARGDRTPRGIVLLAAAWGAGPFLGLLGLIALSLGDPPGSWVLVGGFQAGERSATHLRDLLGPVLYLNLVERLVVFGCGVLGVLGLLAARRNTGARMDPWLKGAVVVSLLAYYAMARIAWMEPQYTLPALFWVVAAAAFGFSPLWERARRGRAARWGLAAAVVLHVFLAVASTLYLKAPRVANVGDIQAAGRCLPPGARVVVWGELLGTCTSPPVWLGRNTLSYVNDLRPWRWESGSFSRDLERLRPLGFTHLLVFDDEFNLARQWARGMRGPRYATNHAGPSSPFRAWCDARFQKVFEGDHVILYALP